MVFNQEYFLYYLMDSQGNESLFDGVESATVDYQALTRLKQKASVSVLLEHSQNIDRNKKLRIYHVLNGVKSLLGTFLMSTPNATYSEVCKQVEITCYSSLWLLDAKKITNRYFVSKGTNVVNECRRLLDGFGFNVNIPESTKTTSNNREWEIGTSILDIVNDLLNSINYTSLYPNQYGDYNALEYILPSDREPTIVYEDSDINNILETTLINEFDYFDIPNVFTRYVANPNGYLIATYENKNPNSVTSTVNAPTNVSAEELTDVADWDTLYEICKKEAQEATNIYHHAEIITAINPQHLYNDCVYLSQYGVEGKFIEYSHSINCETGGSHHHKLRKIEVV